MKKVSRRGFVVGGASVATVAAGACLCTKTGRSTVTGVGSTPSINPGAYDLTDDRIVIQLNKVTALSEVGGSIKILDARLKEPLIVARYGQSDYSAVAIQCPHRGVEVEYSAEDHGFECASLGASKFDLGGKKIKGFARKGLASYKVTFDGDTLSIALS